MRAAVAGRAAPTGVLTSRLGRRFVLLFAMCTILPLIAFATLSVSRVSEQMRTDLRATLCDHAKTAGIGIAARLSQVAGDLALAAELVQNWRNEGAWSDGSALQRQVGGRCASVWLYEAGVARPLCGTAAGPQLDLDENARAHLRSGKPVAQLLGEPAELSMVLAVDPDDEHGPLVAARVRSQWFWDPVELCGANCEFVACDVRGRILFHTLALPPATQPLREAIGREGPSGTIEWIVDGEPHVACYWHASLQAQYALDLVLVQSRAQLDAYGVGDEFVRWFWLAAACTLLGVLLASLVQMRRMLGPIVSLRDAAQRFGRGELDVRVAIECDDEFGELGAAFNEMALRLQENIRRREQTENDLVASRDAALAAAKAKAEFVTNVSHEFRTPMAQILGATEILTQLDERDVDTCAEFAGIALHGAQRLSRLLDDVLELGEPTRGPRHPVDVAASVRAAIEAMRPAAGERVRAVIAADLPPVLGDARRLTETWCRLLDNAIKFSPPGSPIEVSVKHGSAHVVVTVSDHGVGIAFTDRERIFEPFCQVGRDQLIDKAIGTGLGLTLVRSVVEAHGGAIAVSSKLGIGSTFRVTLPVLATADAASAAPVAAAPTAAVPGA